MIKWITLWTYFHIRKKEGFDAYFNQSTITYNFGIEGTAIRSQSFLLEKVIIPPIDPDAIIWMLNEPYDFEYSEENLLDERITLDSPMARYYSGDISSTDL